MSHDPHLKFWAKLGSNPYPEQFHPLLFHLIDVALVARLLWECVLRPPMQERFARLVGLPRDDCAAWVAFWAGAHDIGKASPGFASQSDALRKILREEGFDFLQTRSVPHSTISVPVLGEWLKCHWRADSTDKYIAQTAKYIAQAVGGHHGIFPQHCWGLAPQDLGNDRWSKVRTDILNYLATLLDVPCNRRPDVRDSNDQSYLMVLAGLTTVADWVGSNQAYFPPASDRGNFTENSEQRVQDYFKRAQTQAKQALQELGWVHQAAESRQPAFLELFCVPDLRPLQKIAAKLTETLNQPALILVEAPMGEGKTEAALYLADAWERWGSQGIYVALPTMATSNSMFPRLMHFLERAYAGRLNLHLLHGQALLSPLYESLCQRSQGQLPGWKIYDEDQDASVVLADSWFAQDRKRGLLAPFAVGTIDQALLAVLQTRHGFVRLFGLAGKVVILDEVHAYDVYMTTLLHHLLRWLAALGCPVILLSATLPRTKRQELLNAYANTQIDLAAAHDQPYPRITCVRPADKQVTMIHVPASATTCKTLHLDWLADDLEALAKRLAEALQEGGCAAVIRNTIDSAQETYCGLKPLLLRCGIEIELFHARFPFRRRQEIENTVLQQYGREQTSSRPAKAVLVATQVIEQSLDLDFDLLISDVAPADLILQRAGRLWRHNRHRPKRIDRPTVWLLEPRETEADVPRFGSSEFVYARFYLLRSYLALKQQTTIELPNDIEKLIEAVYGKDNSLMPDAPAWKEALKQAEKQHQKEESDHCRAAKQFLIAGPRDDDNILNRFNQQLEEEDNPKTPPEWRACTRLAEPSIPLVLLYQIDDHLFLDPRGNQAVSLSGPLTLADAKKFLNNAVTIQNNKCFQHYIRQSPPCAWQRSGLLRFYRVVKLDAQGRALCGEFSLRLDPELGILFTDRKD